MENVPKQTSTQKPSIQGMIFTKNIQAFYSMENMKRFQLSVHERTKHKGTAQSKVS